MTQETIEPEQPFKDFYEVLQLHPEADAAMVDQAYWHLARLYNAAIPEDAASREKLDDLNEAYSVLRSAELRGSYDKVRDDVLGEGALPISLQDEEEEAPPLAVMAKQKPKARKANKDPKERKPLRLPSLPWQSVAAVVVFAGLAGGALAIGLPLAFVGGLLFVGVGLGLALLVVQKLPSLPSLPSADVKLPGLRAPRLPERSTDRDGVTADTLLESTMAMRQRWRSETHESTSGLPENTIWPKEIPPPGMSKAGPEGEAEPSEQEAKQPITLPDASRATWPESKAEAPTASEPAPEPVIDTEESGAHGRVSEPAPASESLKNAVGEMRRRWRADAPQDTPSTAPQPREEVEPQVEPALVLRDEDNASAEKPGPFSAASGWTEPKSVAPTASERAPAPAADSESFNDALAELRRKGRADAPQDAPANAPEPSEKVEAQEPPTSVLRDKGDVIADNPGPFSAASGWTEPESVVPTPSEGAPGPVMDTEESGASGRVPEPAADSDSFNDALAELRRRGRGDAAQEPPTSAPQASEKAEVQEPPTSVLRDKDDATAEKPGPFTAASGSIEPESVAPSASEEPAPAPGADSDSFNDALAELRRRGRADAPQETAPSAPEASEKVEPQAQPALVLHEQDDASAEKPGPFSNTSSSPEPASEAEAPAGDDDAPEAPPMDEGLADSLGALRRKWRADAPKDLSTAFPQHTVWGKLDSPETDPPEDDEDSEADPASDPD